MVGAIYKFKNTSHIINNIEDMYIEMEKCQVLQKTVVLSNSKYETSIVDTSGIISNIKNRIISREILINLELSTCFRGVIIIETRYLPNEKDYKSSIDYFEKNIKHIKHTKMSLAANDLFINSKPSDLKKYYMIYHVEDEDLRLEESLYLRGPNVLLSIAGREKISPMVTQLDLIDLVTLNTETKFNIYYYSKSPDTVYYNMFGKVHKLVSTVSDIHDDGISIVFNENGIISDLVIDKENFSKSYIFNTQIEAKHNLNKELILDNKKLDLDIHKTDTNFIMETIKKDVELKKMKLDMLDKTMKLKIEITKGENIAKASAVPMAIKLFMEIVSMIVKKV